MFWHRVGHLQAYWKSARSYLPRHCLPNRNLHYLDHYAPSRSHKNLCCSHRQENSEPVRYLVPIIDKVRNCFTHSPPLCLASSSFSFPAKRGSHFQRTAFGASKGHYEAEDGFGFGLGLGFPVFGLAPNFILRRASGRRR